MGLECKECGCEIEKEITRGAYSLKMCRECYRAYMGKKSRETISEKKYWGEEVPLYAPGQVKVMPGVWDSEEQKELVHNILRTIGWKHNQEKDIWFDNKIRNRDGEWLVDINSRKNLQYKNYKGYESKVRKYVKGNPNKIPKVSYGYNHPEKMFSEDIIRDIQVLFFIEGISTRELVDIYQCTKKNINWVILSTYRAFNRRLDYKKFEG